MASIFEELSVNPYSLHTPEKIAARLAERIRALRLAKGWKQVTLAENAGVSLGSLRRFERTGESSLELLLRLAFVLGRLDDFAETLEPAKVRTMAELEALHRESARRRGRI